MKKIIIFALVAITTMAVFAGKRNGNQEIVKYYLSPKEILSLIKENPNGIKNPNLIFPGQKLTYEVTIFGEKKKVTFEVKNGDNLYKILSSGIPDTITIMRGVDYRPLPRTY